MPAASNFEISAQDVGLDAQVLVQKLKLSHGVQWATYGPIRKYYMRKYGARISSQDPFFGA